MKSRSIQFSLALLGSSFGPLLPAGTGDQSITLPATEPAGSSIKIEGFQAFKGYKLMDWQDGTTIDARGARWLSFMWGVAFNHQSVNDTALNNYPVQLGADWVGAHPVRVDLYNFGLCPEPVKARLHWIGGLIEGVAPLNAGWMESKASNGAGITLNGVGGTVEGVRFHNLHDAIAPLAGNDFVIKDCWVSYNRDDAIENDGFAAGLIDNCLFDGTFVFYSGRNTMANAGRQCEAPGGGSESVVRVQNCLIALESMPGSLNANLTSNRKGLKSWVLPGWGGFWKMSDRDASGHDRNPKIEIVNNVFYIPEPPEGMHPRGYDPLPQKCILSKDNVVIWMGQGEFPHQREGFVVLTGEEGRAYWENAKQAWIDAHPDLSRVKGDPGWTP